MASFDIRNLDNAALNALQASLLQEKESLLQKKLNLDLTRGKPGNDQLALSDVMDGILKILIIHPSWF